MMKAKSARKRKRCVRPALMSASQFPLTSSEAFQELRRRCISLTPVKFGYKPPTMKSFMECLKMSKHVPPHHNTSLQPMVIPYQNPSGVMHCTRMATLHSHVKIVRNQSLSMKSLCISPDGKCETVSKPPVQTSSPFCDPQMDITSSPKGAGKSSNPSKEFLPFKSLHLNETLLTSSFITPGLKQLVHFAQVNAGVPHELSLHESISRIADVFSTSSPDFGPAKPLASLASSSLGENGKSSEIGEKLSLKALQNVLDYPVDFNSRASKVESEIPSCNCIKKRTKTTEYGPIYTHLGAGPSLAAIRTLVEGRVGLKGKAVRIEKLRYTGKEGKTSQGCPISKWIIRRSSTVEKVLVLTRYREGHSCKAAWIVIGLVVWEGVTRPFADKAYRTLADKLSKYGIPNERNCELNKERTCACQGTNQATSGASYTFGCSWAMYNTGCKFARRGYSKAKKFKLLDEREEEGVENIYQTLATDLAPLYARLAPESYRNQVEFEDSGLECRLGRKPGRPWSSVTTCIDFCAHAHKDINNMKCGCTAVVSLTKNRNVAKTGDEQLHVLPLYALEDTDETGSVQGQAKKVKNASVEVLCEYPRHHIYRNRPVKSNNERFIKRPDAASPVKSKRPPSTLNLTKDVRTQPKPKITIPFMGSPRSHRYPQQPLDMRSLHRFKHHDAAFQIVNEKILSLPASKSCAKPNGRSAFTFSAASKTKAMPSTSFAMSDLKSQPQGRSTTYKKQPLLTRVRRPLPTGWSHRFPSSYQVAMPNGQCDNLQNVEACEGSIESSNAQSKHEKRNNVLLATTRLPGNSNNTIAHCGQQLPKAVSVAPRRDRTAFPLQLSKHSKDKYMIKSAKKLHGSERAPIKISVLHGTSEPLADTPIVSQVDQVFTVSPSPRSASVKRRSNQLESRRVSLPSEHSLLVPPSTIAVPTFQSEIPPSIPLNYAQNTTPVNVSSSVQRPNLPQGSCNVFSSKSHEFPATSFVEDIVAFSNPSDLQQVLSSSVASASSALITGSGNSPHGNSAGCAMLATVSRDTEQESALFTRRPCLSKASKLCETESPAGPLEESRYVVCSSRHTRSRINVLNSLVCSHSKRESNSLVLPNIPLTADLPLKPSTASTMLTLTPQKNEVCQVVLSPKCHNAVRALYPAKQRNTKLKHATATANIVRDFLAQAESPVKVVENPQDFDGFYEVFDDNKSAFRDRDMGGVAIALGHGSVLFECARCEVHATTALRQPNRHDPKRISLVFYQHRNLNSRHHGAAEWEQRRESKKGTCEAEDKLEPEESLPNELEEVVPDKLGMMELEEGFVYLDGYENGATLFVVPINPM